MSLMNSRNRRLATAAVVIGTITAACSSERATVFEPVGGASYNARFVPVGTNVPRGTVRIRKGSAPANDTVSVSLQGLEPLETGVYQVWLGDNTGTTPGNFIKATGNLLIIRTDTAIVNGDPVGFPDTTVVPNVSSFANGGPATRLLLHVTPATLGSQPSAKSLVLVTIENDANATAPSAEFRPLWVRYEAPTAAGVVTYTLNFGNFADDPANDYVFASAGRGTIGFRKNVLIVDDSALSKPPKGYYYAMSFLKTDSTTGAVGTGDTVMLGAQTAPYPRRNVSLRDADVNPDLDPVVIETPPAILAAASRFTAPVSAQPFKNYTRGVLTLENKKGFENVISPAIILAVTVPEIVKLGAVPPR